MKNLFNFAVLAILLNIVVSFVAYKVAHNIDNINEDVIAEKRRTDDRITKIIRDNRELRRELYLLTEDKKYECDPYRYHNLPTCCVVPHVHYTKNTRDLTLMTQFFSTLLLIVIAFKYTSNASQSNNWDKTVPKTKRWDKKKIAKVIWGSFCLLGITSSVVVGIQSDLWSAVILFCWFAVGLLFCLLQHKFRCLKWWIIAHCFLTLLRISFFVYLYFFGAIYD
jgi:hypothetical protein